MHVKEDAYSSTLSRNRFLFFEMKIIAKLKLQGLNDQEIQRKVKAENLFQYKTPSGIAKSLNMAMKRVAVLDEFLLKVLAEGNSEKGRLIVLYSIWKMDPLLRDFFIEVVQDKFLTRQYHLADADLRKFFSEKTEQSPVVAGWTDRTFKDLREAYRRILIEVGMASRNNQTIHPLIISPSLLEYLTQIGEKQFVTVLTGEQQ